ncbi:MAG: hypothetical protein LBV19_00205 [Streptococcaceae bacterium]|jgi:hypothetical protein|nr:hypothetical protein [Streptococcaceae bacterium]
MSIQKNRLTGVMALIVAIAFFVTSTQLENMELLRAFPSAPGWLTSMITWVMNVGGGIALLVAVIGSAGIAGVAVALIRKYGFRAGMAL